MILPIHYLICIRVETLMNDTIKKKGWTMKTICEMIPGNRRSALEKYCDSLIKGERGRASWDSFKSEFDDINAEDVIYLVDYIMERVPSIETVKLIVSRLIHAISYTLKPIMSENPPEFLSNMLEENAAIEKCLLKIKNKLKQKDLLLEENELLISNLDDLLFVLKNHYENMENLVFPVLEKEMSEHACTALMWSIHIDAYKAIETGKVLLSSTTINQKEFHRQMGILSFAAGTIIFRENMILFPAMLKLLPEMLWDTLSQYLAEETFVTQRGQQTESFDLGTGTLNRDQLIQLFSNLPVDITLVDKDDSVVFYNTPKKRFFPRTPAVIGRKVHQCHPPKSIAIVERILDGFKEKRHRKAEFTIHIKDQYLLITYFALYDKNDVYDGVLEVLQEISDIQSLSGDKRLLDWDD